MKTLSPVEKKKKLAKVIRGLWESLDTHIDLCIETPKVNKKAIEYVGSKSFHKATIGEYISYIKDLTEIL